MSFSRLLFFSCLFYCWPTMVWADLPAFISTYCLNCHNNEVTKGAVNLAKLATPNGMKQNRKLWNRALEQIEAEEMPPKGKKQPSPIQRDLFVQEAKKELAKLEEQAKNERDIGPAPTRRFTRDEYNRTIRDLFDLPIDVATAVGLPEDTAVQGFDNVADALNIPPVLLEKYFAAADLVVDELIKSAVKAEIAKKSKQKKETSKYKGIFATATNNQENPEQAAKEILNQLLPKAFRRPVEPREVDRYLKLFEKSTQLNTGFYEQMRPVLKTILVSPHFLLRVEANQSATPGQTYRLSSTELANRLSYFIWSSLPDEQLQRELNGNTNFDPKLYQQTVRRLIMDPRSKALTDNFIAQWLYLRKLPEARPTQEFFPTFNETLRQDFQREVETFFEHLLRENHPMTEIIEADYQWVNERLAKHYNIKTKVGKEWSKVPVEDSNRGGLLGMSAFLAINSHTNRTSPTLRGKWILDALLGTPPPPPPADAGMIDEAKSREAGAKNFREMLALHASQPSCANCHAKIDPLGFGLENFDAIGRYRKSTTEINAQGKLPTGETFTGPQELRKVLWQRKDRILRNIAEKMYSYALGRELLATDDPFITEIVQKWGKTEYRYQDLILAIVESEPFTHRRNAEVE